MEIGANNNNGGFHGYKKLPQTSAEVKKSPQPPSTTTIGLLPPPPPLAGGGDECTVREQDRFMPIANVIRIMRRILPPHAKISDDAKETIQECVSEYISFITGEANDRCQREQRKTITAEDVLWAMSKLGFDDYIEPLTVYLHRYRELDGADRGGSFPLPLVKRGPPDHHLGFNPQPMPFQHGFFGGPPVSFGFFKENGSVGPSSQFKEQNKL